MTLAATLKDSPFVRGWGDKSHSENQDQRLYAFPTSDGTRSRAGRVVPMRGGIACTTSVKQTPW
jgi:hypothetical protein